MMNFPNKIGPYIVYGILGSGAYGKVLAVRNPKTLQNYAMKISEEKKSLKKEYKILKTLSKCEDFMKVYEYGTFQNFDYIVMEKFSKNLQYKNNDSMLSLKCISAIGLEILKRIEVMHKFDILHRDIKPSQYLLNENKENIYLIDFGVSTYYRKNNVHRAFKEKSKFKGSIMFSSANTHFGYRQSRRDDLESFLYSLVYLFKGSLPWGININLDHKQNMKLIMKCKISIKPEILLKDFPIEFESIYKYIKKLSYDQTPNYAYIQGLLENFIENEPIYKNFDWVSNPDFFGKMVSRVENNENSQLLRIKNSNGEFMAKRRTGKINTGMSRRLSKSFDVLKIKEIAKEYENYSKNQRPNSNFLCVDNILSIQASSFDFSRNGRNASCDDQASEEPNLTARHSPPKFLNREAIISARNEFLAMSKKTRIS